MSESAHRESPKHLHSHTLLRCLSSSPSLFPFPSYWTTLPPCTPQSLCAYNSKSLPPNCLHFLCGLISAFLTVNVQQVKQPHNRSGPLSLIMASVYYRFHAPPHHQTIFPHRKTHKTHACAFLRTQMYKHINIHVLVIQPNDLCAHALIRVCSYSNAGLSVGASRIVIQISITWADYEWKEKQLKASFMLLERL